MGRAKGGDARYARKAGAWVALVGATIVLLPFPVAAFDAQIGWTPVQNASGYRVYVRRIGQLYSGGTDVGRPQADGSGAVHYVVHGLPNGILNYFAVTDYNASGRESGLSNELSLLVGTPPAATLTPSRAATALRTPTSTARGTPPPTAAPTRSAVPTSTRSLTPMPTPTQLSAWNVSIPTDAVVEPGVAISVPVTITAGSDASLLGLRVVFNPSVVALQSVRLSAAAGEGTLITGLVTPGDLTVLAILLQSMAAAGTLLDVSFTAVGPCGPSTALQISSCTLDGGAIRCQPRSGRITVRCG